MTPTFAPKYFADENVLGFAKLLRDLGRDDILFPGHPDLPEVPLGSLDLEWMPRVSSRGLVVVTRDRRIRTRPAELAAYREHGIRSVWIGARVDLSSQDQVELFLRHERRLQRLIVKLGDGPWALAMNIGGLRPLRVESTD